MSGNAGYVFAEQEQYLDALNDARERIAELEAATAALREFVEAFDSCADGYWSVVGETGCSLSLFTARQRLATDYGIPLPGQEGEG